jgi:hypothetical protein
MEGHGKWARVKQDIELLEGHADAKELYFNAENFGATSS